GGRVGDHDLRALAAGRVPDPRRAVRELEPALQRAARHAGGGGRRVHGALAARVREQRVRADRHRDADRARGEERDPDRRVREARVRARRQDDRRGGARGRAAAPAADPDDRLRVHPGRAAARDRERLGRRGAPHPRHDGDRRHAGRLADRDLPDPRPVLRRAAPRAPRRPRGAGAAAAARRARAGPRARARAERRRRFVRRRAPATALALLTLAGCAVGPSYRRPESAVPAASYRGTPEDPASLADLPWFEVFRDEVLRGLVAESLARNRDLLAAAERVEQARGLAAVQRGALFPQADFDLEASRGRDALLGRPAAGIGTQNLYFGALNAAWELDVWGRIRRATEAARAELLATEAFRRGVVLSLVTGVAQAYFELRGLDLELEITRRTVASFRETRDLFERQFRGG